MKGILLLLVVAFVHSGVLAAILDTCCLPFNPQPMSTSRSNAKKVFAYYFPPFPISIENADPASDYYSKWNNPTAFNGDYQKQGGYIRDRPLARPKRTASNWFNLNYQVEVRQAISMGLDGFIYEHPDHTITDNRWNHLKDMLDAAKAVDPTFKIMLSPDIPDDRSATSYTAQANIIISVKDHPSLFKLADGTIVTSTFYPERLPIKWWTDLKSYLAGKGVKVAYIPNFLSWPNPTTASSLAEWNPFIYGYTQWGSRWPSSTKNYITQAGAAHNRGRKWMSTVALQDVRPKSYTYWESGGSQLYRQSWEAAITGNADFVNIITWNDYSETPMAPSKNLGYAALDIGAYYVHWYKTGKKPTIVRDALYYFHRNQLTTASYNTKLQTGGSIKIPYGDPAVNVVELVAFLTSPGTLTITQGSKSESKSDTVAGLNVFKVNMIAGTTPVFKLTRKGVTVATITSKTAIRSTVDYQDMAYHAGGGLNCPNARPGDKGTGYYVCVSTAEGYNGTSSESISEDLSESSSEDNSTVVTPDSEEYNSTLVPGRDSDSTDVVATITGSSNSDSEATVAPSTTGEATAATTGDSEPTAAASTTGVAVGGSTTGASKTTGAIVADLVASSGYSVTPLLYFSATFCVAVCAMIC